MTEAQAKTMVLGLEADYKRHHSGDLAHKLAWINAKLKEEGYLFQVSSSQQADPCASRGHVTFNNSTNTDVGTAFLFRGDPCVTVNGAKNVHVKIGADVNSDSNAPPAPQTAKPRN
jgi:hypothetical protein